MTKHEQNPLNLAINAKKTLCYLSKANGIVPQFEVTIIKRLKMTCANSDIRIYHLVIAGFTADYKKQVIITGIKSRMHYSTYIV